MTDERWLHLFTSNIRPIYEHDAIDLLAAPAGFIMRFRYAEEYLSPGLAERWRSDGLVGTPVRTYFSLQQEARYHPAAFVPLRNGKVVRSGVEGSTFVINFALGEYVALAAPSGPAKEGPDQGALVQKFTEGLSGLLGDNVPDKKCSAAEGPSADGLLDTPGDQAAAFERAVLYLRKTRSFHSYVFARVEKVTRLKSGTDVPMKDGEFALTAGESYELVIAHFQGTELPGNSSLSLATDEELVRVVGNSEVAIGSRYDAVPIRLFVPARDDVQHSTLSLSPTQGIAGPSIQVPVRVEPSALGTGLYAAGTAAALGVAAVPGAVALNNKWGILAVVGAAVLGSLVTILRRMYGHSG